MNVPWQDDTKRWVRAIAGENQWMGWVSVLFPGILIQQMFPEAVLSPTPRNKLYVS